MNFEIRNLTSDDLDIFTDLWCQLSTFNYHSMNLQKKQSIEDRLSIVKERAKEVFNQAILNNHPIILIAYIQNHPVAYTMAFILEDGTGSLDHLFVNEQARGHGIGKSLLNHIKQLLLERNVTKFSFNVFSWNIEAQRFYEKLGYKQYYITYQSFLKE